MEGPLNYTRTYKARYNEEKGITVTRRQGIGHWVMVEAKDEVTEIVASWLKRLTSSFPHGKL